MKLVITVALIGSIQAQTIFRFRRNPFVTDWKTEVSEENCPYGPKRCGLDEDGEDRICGNGQACLQPIRNSATCTNAFPW